MQVVIGCILTLIPRIFLSNPVSNISTVLLQRFEQREVSKPLFPVRADSSIHSRYNNLTVLACRQTLIRPSTLNNLLTCNRIPSTVLLAEKRGEVGAQISFWLMLMYLLPPSLKSAVEENVDRTLVKCALYTRNI